ncbi:hypothetical protein Poly24_40350 [Rosistilla carotiformis]|uniref:Uncharacterized protein n=1 Tax=Rosistilla carotiformis TaxID=2528017 RepID=A0A518JXP6_9BACT|nr:hypothetical protein Poly24_40350 [Rosistilla carotiformis]
MMMCPRKYQIERSGRESCHRGRRSLILAPPHRPEHGRQSLDASLRPIVPTCLGKILPVPPRWLLVCWASNLHGAACRSRTPRSGPAIRGRAIDHHCPARREPATWRLENCVQRQLFRSRKRYACGAAAPSGNWPPTATYCLATSSTVCWICCSECSEVMKNRKRAAASSTAG